MEKINLQWEKLVRTSRPFWRFNYNKLVVVIHRGRSSTELLPLELCLPSTAIGDFVIPEKTSWMTSRSLLWKYILRLMLWWKYNICSCDGCYCLTGSLMTIEGLLHVLVEDDPSRYDLLFPLAFSDESSSFIIANDSSILSETICRYFLMLISHLHSDHTAYRSLEPFSSLIRW